MYWPAFEFEYSFDIQKLMPHIMAIEAYKQGALTPILPPQWREPPVQSDSRKTKNARNAQDWVKRRFVPGSAPIALADILTAHRMLAEESYIHPNTAGMLRTSGIQVGRQEVGGIHAGAPVGRLPLLMDQYIQLINSQQSLRLHPVIHALLAHFFFTTLHPLGDGNGRMSRLVATGILFQRGYNVHGGFYALSDYFYRNDGIPYHTLLHRCWQQGAPFDLTPFVAFGMEGLVMELRSINSFIKMKLNRIVDRDALVQSVGKRRRKRRSKLAAVINPWDAP